MEREGCIDRSTDRRLDADLLTAWEIERRMRRCSNRAPTGLRNRALIAALWRCGLRLGEALALQGKDINLVTGSLLAQHGEGGQETRRRHRRRNRGPSRAVANRTEEAALGRLDPGLCTLVGRQLNQSYVRHLLPRLARRAGVDKRVHAHALRHAYAIELEREGAELSLIRDLHAHQ
jgi:integrase/recombinase XerD